MAERLRLLVPGLGVVGRAGRRAAGHYSPGGPNRSAAARAEPSLLLYRQSFSRRFHGRWLPFDSLRSLRAFDPPGTWGQGTRWPKAMSESAVGGRVEWRRA